MNAQELSPSGVLSPAARRQVLIAVSVGVFMSTLDGSIVNVALPTIARQFGAGVESLQWVVTSYLLTITSLLPVWGKLADLWGRGKIYTWGFLGFIFGSALCSLAWDVVSLSLFRVVQGLGAAMLMANSMAIISEVYPPQERGKALGLVGTAVSLGSLTGPGLGGLLVGLLSWRSIFYVNVPIGIAGFLLGRRVLVQADQTPTRRVPFDRIGAVLSVTGTLSLLLALGNVSRLGWAHPLVLGGFTLAVVLALQFIRVETRMQYPLIDLKLFRNPGVSFGMLAGLLSFIAPFFASFLVPQVSQNALGLSPQASGIIMTAMPVVMLIAGPVSGWLSDRTGPTVLTVAGMAVLAAGLFSLSLVGPGMGVADLAWRVGLLGLGMGLFQSPNNSAVLGSVSGPNRGVIGGLLATMRNLGMMVGVAVAATLFAGGLGGQVPSGGTVPPDLLPAYFASFARTMWIAAGVALVAVLPAAVRPRPVRGQ